MFDVHAPAYMFTEHVMYGHVVYPHVPMHALQPRHPHVLIGKTARTYPPGFPSNWQNQRSKFTVLAVRTGVACVDVKIVARDDPSGVPENLVWL